MSLQPFVVANRVERQQVDLVLNGVVLRTVMLDRWEWTDIVAPLPEDLVGPFNTLELRLPDAVSPKSIDFNGDEELHGVLVQQLELCR